MRESDGHPGPTGGELACYCTVHPDDMEGTVTVEG
jgi:plastocyanin